LIHGCVIAPLRVGDVREHDASRRWKFGTSICRNIRVEGAISSPQSEHDLSRPMVVMSDTVSISAKLSKVLSVLHLTIGVGHV